MDSEQSIYARTNRFWKGFFDVPEAESLWREVTERLITNETVKTFGQATIAAQENARYGNPILVAPRIGQRSFRALVTDAYSYRCAISRERTLPVLQAAHIRPYAEGGSHELSNGLLLRSDLHPLFDQHYLTIDPNKNTLIVSRRIREQFEMAVIIMHSTTDLLSGPLSSWRCPR